MLDDYKKRQPIFYDFVINSVNNNKISHAYLIESNGVSYGYDLGVCLAKYFLSSKNDRIVDEVDNEICSDLYLVNNGLNEIKKSDIENIKNFFSVKSYSDNYRIYVINNADLMNLSASNALLKFLEEPNDNIIGILVVDSISRLIDTIVSRCLVLSLIPDFTNLNDLFIAEYDDKGSYAEFFNKKIKEIIDFFVSIEMKKNNIFCDNIVYSFKDSLKNVFLVGLYLYYDVLNLYFCRDLMYIDGFDDEKKIIMKNNEINVIIKKISLINDFVIRSYENVNKDLLIDDFVIKMSGVDICG